MSKVMTDLNYGGRLIAYEDNEDWYKRNKDLGLYENSEVHLVPVLKGERDWCVKDVGGTGTYCYFDHDFSDIDSVDFIFDDGPSFPFGAKFIDNWFMAANHFENQFDLIVKKHQNIEKILSNQGNLDKIFPLFQPLNIFIF